MSPRHSSFVSFLAPLGACTLAVLAACDRSDRLVGPESRAPQPALEATQQADLESVQAPEVGTQFADLFERILPSFSDQTLAASLRESLDDFEAEQRAGNAGRAEESLSRARALLARSDAHPANLGALRLALARAESLLDVMSAPQATEPAPGIAPVP